MITCKETDKGELGAPCIFRQLMDKLQPSKKKKCCKSFKDGKRCKRCPKR